LVALLIVAQLAVVASSEAQFGRSGPRGGGGVARPPAAEEDKDRAGKYALSPSDAFEALGKGEGRQALEAYDKAAREAEAQGKTAFALRAHAVAALVALRLGSLQRALTHGGRALDLSPQAPDSPVMARTIISNYITLGSAYNALGDSPNARKTYAAGLAYARAAVQKYERATTVALASFLSRYAQFDLKQGERRAAMDHNAEAARILEGFDLQRVPDVSRTMIAAHATNTFVLGARLALTAGQIDDADKQVAKASHYARIVGFADVDAEVMVMAAQVALARGDAARALKLLGEARDPAERSGRMTVLVELDRLLATANDKLGKVEDALAAAKRSIARVEGMRGEVEDPGQRATFLEQRQAIYHYAVQLALRASKPDEAFALAERSRSRAFLDLLGSHTTLSKGQTRALAQEESALRERLQEAAALAAEGDDAAASRAGRAKVEALEREYAAFLARVRKESGEQASLMSVDPVTLPEIQALLPEGTTLLEYLVSDAGIVLWIVDRRSVQVRRMPEGRVALTEAVRQFRGAIANVAPLPEVERRARALHQTLIAPAQDAIHGTRLLIVPHGVLHYLPFSALRLPEGRWLVEAYPLATLPSASVLKFLTDKGAKASDRILAIGNPDLGPGLALPYAEREVRSIGDRFPSTSTVLIRADASEHRVKQIAAQAGLLHFAVHGDLNEDDPMASALLLTPGGGDDGRLEVRELFGMELNARLVVLSACETGLGKLSRGDELVGLQRAFLYAGTPAVVTTLWKVDDRASFLLMRSFYENLDAKGATEALRAAQRAVFTTNPHPFAWAAFGLTGAPR
jgi:CHAT domain-containing protein